MSRAKTEQPSGAASGSAVSSALSPLPTVIALTPVTATPASVRQVNRSIVLKLIRTQEPVSRADLARMMGVVRSTITGIVDDLVEAGIIEEERGSLAGRGRSPMHLRLKDDSVLVAGVHVRANTTVVALAGLRAAIFDQVSFPTPRSAAELVKTVARTLRRHAKSGMPSHLAVALPGLVDYQSGRVLWVPMLGEYRGYPLADALTNELGIPATVDNDCNLGALSEAWRLGNTPESRHMVFINIGDSGVGAGIVLNGEVYRGHDARFVAELGHMVVETAGPKCICGRRGCWETFICNSAVWKRYSPRRPFSAEAFHGFLQDVERDRRARDVFRETAKYLRAGIGNVISILNPYEIVLSGSLMRRWDFLEGLISSNAAPSFGDVVVRPARHPEEESLLHGAICAALDRFFSQPKFGWGADE